LSDSLSQAQILSTIGGSLLIDRAGREARESIDHAQEAASALLERANELGKQRLDQIDTILKKTVGGLIGQTEESERRL
jgi:F0F1-type ATP synthase membrane subunit b/b'